MKHSLPTVAAIVHATGAATAASAEPFDGPHVGVQGGWSQTDLGRPSTPVGALTVDRSRDAASVGVYTGYDVKVNPSVVLGAEAGVQFGADDSIVLGAWLAFAAGNGVSLTGASDHLVSEAVYLVDREGNGIEIYADRPRATWRQIDGMIEMATAPLDLNELVAAAGARTWSGFPSATCTCR